GRRVLGEYHVARAERFDRLHAFGGLHRGAGAEARVTSEHDFFNLVHDKRHGLRLISQWYVLDERWRVSIPPGSGAGVAEQVHQPFLPGGWLRAGVGPNRVAKDVADAPVGFQDWSVVFVDRLNVAGELLLGDVSRCLSLEEHLSDRNVELAID